MFKLAARHTTGIGLYCGQDGLYLGTAVLIEPEPGGGYRVRPVAEIEALLAAAYKTPPAIERLLDGVQRVAGHLCAGNMPLAMIAAVHCDLPDIEEDRIERLARTDALLKANYNTSEPRDAQGRWTDGNGAGAGNSGGDEPAGVGRGGRDVPESAGSSDSQNIPTNAGGSGPSVSRAWENYPNADFRNRLAVAERSAGHKNFGYGEVNDSPDPNQIALGRYQLTPVALRAAGIMDRTANWTGKYGIHSRTEFLADPDAQEKALTDYLNDNERQLRALGAFTHIGETIHGLDGDFQVTRAGIMAAAHREGAPATKDYLNRVKMHGLTSRGLRLKRADQPIETRLRTFSKASYE